MSEATRLFGPVPITASLKGRNGETAVSGGPGPGPDRWREPTAAAPVSLSQRANPQF